MSAVLVSVWKHRSDREQRIQIGCNKLHRAVDDYFNPAATSTAFRYMKTVGLVESESILRRFAIESPLAGQFLYFRLPFLYGSGNGIPPKSDSFTYAGGLVFHLCPSGLLPSLSIDEIEFGKLEFNANSFVPDKDLSNTLSAARLQFERQMQGSRWRAPDQIETYINIQAAKMLDRDDLEVFLAGNSVSWDARDGAFHAESEP